MSDRRRLGERPGRQDHEAVVRLRCPGRTRVHTGFLKNLSHAGMFLRILEPEVEGVRIGFDVFFTHEDDRRETLTGEGEVAWSRAEYEGPGLPPGMGIRFLSLGPGGADLLSRILASSGVSEGSEEGPVGDLAGDPAESEGPTRILGDPSMAPGSESELVDVEDEIVEGPGSTRSRIASPALWLLLAVGALALGAGLWWLRSGGGGSISERPMVEVGPSERSRIGGESTALVEEVDPEPVEEPAVDDGASTGLAEEALVAPRTPVARRIRDVGFESGEAVSMVVVRGDGRFDTQVVSTSYIGGDRPRIVVEVQGVERSGDGIRLEPEDTHVRAVRTGYHVREGRESGSLHVVIEVTDAAVRVLRLLPTENELLVYLGLPDDESPEP